MSLLYSGQRSRRPPDRAHAAADSPSAEKASIGFPRQPIILLGRVPAQRAVGITMQSVQKALATVGALWLSIAAAEN